MLFKSKTSPKIVKAFLFLFCLLSFFSVLHGESSSYPSISGWDLGAEESRVIQSIIDYAAVKKYNLQELQEVINERKLKGATFNDLLEALAVNIKNQAEAETLAVYYSYDPGFRKTSKYLVAYYSVFQIQQLVQALEKKKTGKREVIDFLDFGFYLSTEGISRDDGYNLLFLMIEKNSFQKSHLKMVIRILTRHKDIGLSKKELADILIKELLKDRKLPAILHDIEKEKKYQ